MRKLYNDRLNYFKNVINKLKLKNSVQCLGVGG